MTRSTPSPRASTLLVPAPSTPEEGASPGRRSARRPGRAVLRLLLPAAVGLAGLVGPPAVAGAAETEIRSFPATVVVQNGTVPPTPNECTVAGFVQWKPVAGATPKSVTFTYAGGTKESRPTGVAPFDDTFTFGITYRTTPGTHWKSIGTGASSGGPPNDCSEGAMTFRALFATPEATVEMEVPKAESAACTSARKSLAARRREVTKLQKRLRSASRARRRSLGKKLVTAKNRARTAAATVEKRC